MMFFKVKGTKSWLDPLSQRSLSANLCKRLWDRCHGRRGLFVTLTYKRDDYESPLDLYREQSEQQHVPLFLRKVSRYLGVNLKGKWFCKMEFQDGGWVHWHIIILGVERIPHAKATELWGRGHVWLRRLNLRNIRYCTKYVAKDGQVPQFLYGEPPKSIKIVRVSPGFWGDTEPKEPDDDPPPKRKRWPYFVPIGEKIERARAQVVVHDEEGKFRTVQADLGPLLAALMVRGCGLIGTVEGWFAVEAGWCDVEACLSPPVGRASRPEATPTAGGGSAALHLTEARNRDVQQLPGWLRAFLCETLTPRFSEGGSS